MGRLKIIIGYLRNLFIAVSNRITVLASLVSSKFNKLDIPGTSYGSNKDHADKWNGTAFSATSTVPYGLNDMMGAGSQAAGTAFGGGGGSHVDTCVTYA